MVQCWRANARKRPWAGRGEGWVVFCIPGSSLCSAPLPTYLLSYYLSSLPVTTVHSPSLSSYVHNGGEGRQEEADVRLATTGVI